jgi:DNA-binding NarL/FixJ family response regulator
MWREADVRTEFVGRERELSVLTAALADARAGRPRLVLCRGEPGIGKTRLAEELASCADDAAVAWATATEDAGAPPFWPWRQVLRALHRGADLGAVAGELGVTPDLARLAPELFPLAAESTSDGSGDDRFRLFDAVARMLSALTAARPVLVVLDDAQWADPGSLLLLRHVAHGLDRERLLVLVNHRDTGPVPAVLATELLREPRTWPLDVRGLASADVARQLGALVGREVPEREVAQVHARTGGNPFFVGEVGRMLLDDGHRDGTVPASVRDAIGARIARLAPATADALQAAAIVGREFRVAVVAAMLGAPVLDCLAALDEAAGAGLVESLSTPGEQRFVHDLVRDAVEAGLRTPDRVRLHRSAAAAVEAAAGGRVETHLADLARHWAVAAVAGERSEAAAWIGRAADEAVRGLAYEEAGRLYRLALDVAADEIDDVERCRILLAVGGALRLAEHVPGRVEACLEAAGLARRLGRADLLAEAAVILEGGDADLAYERRLGELCEEALAALDPTPTPLRARVAANLSDVCMYLGDTEAAALASDEALAIAERCGDPVTLVAALRARQLVCSGPEGIAERARLAERMLALGRTTGTPGTRLWGHLWRIDVGFQRGDLASVARELEPLAVCVEQVRGPVARWHLLQARAVLAQAQARFADARRLADQALAALPPTATGHQSAVINRTAVLSPVQLHTGVQVDLAGLRAAGDPEADPHQGFPTGGTIFAVAAAYMLAAQGCLAEARAAYLSLGPPGQWRPFPHTRSVCEAFGIGTAIALDLPEDVAVLSERLARLRGEHLASGAGCVAYNGPVELYLGQAAGYLGLLSEAVADLETAARACAANGAGGFHVEARCRLAETLARRARPGDAARARALALDVAKEAEALGMIPWVERARRHAARLDQERGDPLTPREREVAALVAEGLTNREIAARLYLSERTAQNHVQHILTKLGLPNRGQVAVYVTRRMSSGSE